jgi:hypothetical protein
LNQRAGHVLPDPARNAAQLAAILVISDGNGAISAHEMGAL